MLGKVKDGGNAIIAACISGIKDNGVGLNMAKALDELSGSRLNLYLSTGYVQRRGDDPNPGPGYAPSTGQKIEGPLGVKAYGLSPGFLKYNSNSSSYIKNIIIHLAGSPIEFK